ncbi:MAG: DMT family transporter [Pseudomonadota bacterium]
MRLALLTALVMVAFAANSVLNRAAVGPGHIDPGSFAAIRVVAGAVMLCAILAVRRVPLPLLARARLPGVLGLSAYMTGFSLAYLTLDAGLGALILFGTVQIGMFAWGAVTGAPPTRRALLGAGVAFAGLMLALWPGSGAAADPVGAALMVIAGLGWAAYTLAGRGAPDALAATAANFVWSVPLLALVLLGPQLSVSGLGAVLAILSGAVTSGLGYALWYAVLRKLNTSTASVVQLSVPMIAIAGGALVLAETPDIAVLFAAVLVVGGIALAVTGARR